MTRETHWTVARAADGPQDEGQPSDAWGTAMRQLAEGALAEIAELTAALDLARRGETVSEALESRLHSLGFVLGLIGHAGGNPLLVERRESRALLWTLELAGSFLRRHQLGWRGGLRVPACGPRAAFDWRIPIGCALALLDGYQRFEVRTPPVWELDREWARVRMPRPSAEMRVTVRALLPETRWELDEHRAALALPRQWFAGS